jgi:hypothetical protein
MWFLKCGVLVQRKFLVLQAPVLFVDAREQTAGEVRVSRLEHVEAEGVVWVLNYWCVEPS